mmetsp:Transcript_119955/g.188175  ORF Transcript_119955/g.188175 Transcript_119955/m.188175 type:complete len:206 (+) Transcript_119955:875-1492(+)
MSKTTTCCLPMWRFTSSANSTATATPSVKILTPMSPLPTWTCTVFSHGCLANAASISAFQLSAMPNFESAVDTLSAAILPAPTNGFIRRPMSDVLDPFGNVSRTLATTSNSSKLSMLRCMPAASAWRISAAVFAGESKMMFSDFWPKLCACIASPILAVSAPKPRSRAISIISARGFDFTAIACKKPAPKASRQLSKLFCHAPKS